MKFETIVTGAGLAGLTAAIRLAEAEQKVGLISAGHSALHFCTGSFGLLGFDSAHKAVEHPLEAFADLADAHPYKKIGSASLEGLADEAVALLNRAGVKTAGSARENHTRISPLGVLRPAWLTLENMATLEALKSLKRPHVVIAGIAGFLDFYPRFIAATLEKEGIKCDIVTVDNADLRNLRKSESEMRSANIARVLRGEALVRFAESVHDAVSTSEAEAVILPAVVEATPAVFEGIVGRKVLFAPTVGVSVPGIEIHSRLIRRFTEAGGRLLNGHRVTGADFDGDRLTAVYTDRLDDDALYADNFIFAAGSFFGRGLTATPDEVIEPVFGLDTVAPTERDGWFTADLFGVQPVMNAGVAVDDSFRAMRSGVPVRNLYAAGACIAGADSLHNDSGAGVAMLTALTAADKIIK